MTSAHDGDTISLASGEYTLEKLQNLTFAKGVTVTSADPTHKAIIDGIYLQDSSGLTFNDLEVKVDPRQQVGVIVQGGGNVTLENLDIHGTGVGNGLGIRLGTVSNVTVANNEIHGTDGGITASYSTGVSILSNRVHDIESDGFQSLASSNETISGNYFTNFFPAAGDHSDAMQFIGVGAAAQNKNITITNNTYFRGTGAANTQGIFMGNEGGAGANYENVVVSGNTIIGGVYQGIMVSAADHLTLTHNTVEGYTDQGSWILISNSTNASETNNIATAFNPGSNNTDLVTSGNVTITPGAVGDTSVLKAHDLSVNATPGGGITVTAPPTSSSPQTPPPQTSAPPAEITGTIVSKVLAVAKAPANAGQVIIDPNTHVWSNAETGGAGADTLNTGAGGDTLTGGAGAGHFVFSKMPGGPMDVTDFTHGQDVLDVRGLLSTVGYKGTNAIADHVLVLQSDGAGGTKVLLDADGTGPKAGTYVLHLDYVAPTTLTTSDWVFH